MVQHLRNRYGAELLPKDNERHPLPCDRCGCPTTQFICPECLDDPDFADEPETELGQQLADGFALLHGEDYEDDERD